MTSLVVYKTSMRGSLLSVPEVGAAMPSPPSQDTESCGKGAGKLDQCSIKKTEEVCCPNPKKEQASDGVCGLKPKQEEATEEVCCPRPKKEEPSGDACCRLPTAS